MNIFLFCSIFIFKSMTYADLANDLLLSSDRARGSIKDGVQWKISVQTQENDRRSERDFEVKAKGDDALIEATAPQKNKGEVYVFNDRSMWFFKPSLKKPVSISARQKLSGQTANGDIASTHYARDYSAVIEKTEMINSEKVHVLMLTAKTKNLTYDKIRYWIGDKNKLAIKAEFLTLQGKPFKIGFLKYENKMVLKGETIPFISELKIVDAKFPKNFSVMSYKSPKVIALSSTLFNVNNLTR